MSSKNASALDPVSGVGVTPNTCRRCLAVNHGSGRRGENERQDRKELHGLVTVNCPDPRSPLHEFEPLYVPVMDDELAWPVLEILAEQDPNGLSNPPGGILTENVIDAPETVPEMEPRPVMPVLGYH